MSILEDIREAVIEGQADETMALVEKALAEDIPADKILYEALIDAMSEVGDLFENGEFFVPEMLIAARAMKGALIRLKTLLVDSGVESLGKVALGTVKGDLHDIGKSLVGMMLEGAGFEVVDLGVDVAPEKFIDELQNGAQIIAMSALLTTTMANMAQTIEAIEEAGLRDNAAILVGGAPITPAYAEQIGADGYAPDASAAVRKARELVGK
jgi:5-methyltetrahydrofolate--homocysteine methyltransferase